MKLMKFGSLLAVVALMGANVYARQIISLNCQTQAGGFCSGSGGCFSDESHLRLTLADLNGTANLDGSDFVVDASPTRRGLALTGQATSHFSFIQDISATVDLSANPVTINLTYEYKGVTDQLKYTCTR